MNSASTSALEAAILAERVRFADLIAGLDEDQLSAPSLCGAWTVREVAGHLYVAQLWPASRFVVAFVRAGLRPNRANELAARTAARLPIAQIAAELRAASRAQPVPIVGYDGPLADLVIHAADIAVPLGLRREPESASAELVLDFLTRGRAPGFVAKGVLGGLRLHATDLDRSFGSGQLVEGLALDLMLTATGRAAGVPGLRGPGAGTLAARLTAR